MNRPSIQMATQVLGKRCGGCVATFGFTRHRAFDDVLEVAPELTHTARPV